MLILILTTYTIYRMNALPSTELLLNRVRPNATYEDQWHPGGEPAYDLARKISMLDELKALDWRTEKKSMMIILYNIIDKANESNDIIVPNVVHYVWLGTDLNFTFINYLSFLSVHRFIRPQFIFVYGEQGPSGTWWKQTLHDVHNIYHVVRTAPREAPSGERFRYKAHASDLLRTQIICELGGIYLDADVIVLKSFDELRTHPTVMGRETSYGICNGIIISIRRAPFVRMLLEQYKDYAGSWESWDYRSVLVPHILAEEFPSLIHVEQTRLNRPNYQEISLIYDDDNLFDWRDNFSIHLWVRMQRQRDKSRLIEEGPEQINCLRSTLGEITRLVYYGASTLRC